MINYLYVKVNADAILQRMNDKYWTKVTLSKKSGVSKCWLYEMKNGKSARNITVSKLAKALKCKPEELILHDAD